MKVIILKALLCSLFVFSANAQGLLSQEQDTTQSSLGSLTKKHPKYTREMVLGNILKGALENMHLANKSIDDDLSKKAFDLYIERIDYGKQFLIEPEIKELRKYADKFDDELITGQLSVVDATTAIMTKRLKEVQVMIEDILSKSLDYKKKDKLETDAEKRKFVKNMAELKVLWERLLKYEILNRIVDLKEERDQTDKEKEKAKDKKNKKKSLADGEDLTKLTDTQIEEKARKKVLESYRKILSRMGEEKKDDKLDKFYNAITKVFDPHTNYLTPEEKEDFDTDISGKLEGIGAILREDTSFIKVERIVPGSASWKTKELEAEDTILKVAQGSDEPVDIVDMSLRDAVKLIRGKKGTEVRLTVKKPNGLIKVVPIVRDVVEIEESYAKATILDFKNQKQKYGYITLPKFYRDFSDRSKRNCTDDIRNELVRLKEKNVDGLILDLRNNGGGALEDARLISGLFIDKGPIVQVKASTGSVEVLSDTDEKIEFDKPMIVLINRFSASASEIVAAALQDYDRAIVVGGEFSHGKGTVQLVVELDNYVAPMAKSFSPLGSLKITIQKFYRINGGSTQYKGVTPDIILPDPFGHLDSGEQSLKHSIPWGEVKAVSYKKWTKTKFDKKKLAQQSAERVKVNPRFKVIVDNIKWYDLRKKQTVRSLAMDDFVKDRQDIKARTDLYDKDLENADIEVTNLDPSEDKVAKEKFDDFSKTVKKDVTIEESMNILSDIAKL